VRETDVGDEPVAEERADAPLGAVEELVGDDQVQRHVLFLQAADGAGRQDALDAQGLHREDVGAERQLGRREPVADAVPGEEHHLLAGEPAGHQRRRGRAERRLDRHVTAVRELGHVVEATASNDPDRRGHACVVSSSCRGSCG
jgi:hypothetical protein